MNTDLSSIRISHTLFGGRASHFGGGSSQDRSKYTYEINDDLSGHGTHVAGTIGAERFGVAPFVNLISVKVLGSGSRVPSIVDVGHDVTGRWTKPITMAPSSLNSLPFLNLFTSLSFQASLTLTRFAGHQGRDS